MPCMPFWSRASHITQLALLVALVLEGPAAQAEPVDYHTIRGRKPRSFAFSPGGGGLIEGEHLPMKGTARAQDLRAYGAGWSGGAHLLWDGKVGQQLETLLRIEAPGRYRVSMQFTQAPDYGVVEVELSGKRVAKEVDLYAENVRPAELLELGEIVLKDKEQQLVLRLTGGNPKASKFQGGYLVGMDYLKLQPVDSADPDEGAEPIESQFVDQISSEHVTFEEVRPLMAEYCFGCHGSKKVKGKINLEELVTPRGHLENMTVAGKIADALAFREMPPEDEKQLPPDAHAALNAWIQGVIDEHLANSPKLTPVVMRRMNRYQYNNSVRHLLQLKGDIYPLPEKVVRAAVPYFDPASGRFPDSVTISNRALGKNQIEQHILTGVVPFAIDLQAEHGFNNRGEELSFPPILLESFLELGHSVVHSPEFDAYSALGSTLFAPLVEEATVEVATAVAQARLRPLLERAFRRPAEVVTVARYSSLFSPRV